MTKNEIRHVRWVSISNQRTGEVIGSHVKVARTFWQRFKGLMGTTTLAIGRGMLFPHTNSVHMFFMHYPLCVVYLTRDFVVLRRVVLKPWRIGPIIKGTYWILELPEPVAKQIMETDTLIVTGMIDIDDELN
ncbi:DUF192 domain-containing protein [Sulfobacillus thermosulfidooxidans]|uniref:DUF192 domain-containing protein n=1 Tax=Sulfobacillus thermosulfidooxidans TaxID=28034 RepID=UPI0009DEE277|nr:DUF192 domain-containing protein [Sulfobacillus thermosulfidooxidans]